MACIGEMARSSLESGRSREQKGLLPVPRFILSGAPAFRFHTASGYMIPSFDRFVFDQSQCRSFAGPVEGDALDTDSDLGQIRPHLGVEPMAIHWVSLAGQKADSAGIRHGETHRRLSARRRAALDGRTGVRTPSASSSSTTMDKPPVGYYA